MIPLFMDGFEMPTANKTAGIWSACQGALSSSAAHLYSSAASGKVRSGTGALRAEVTFSTSDIYLMKRFDVAYTHLVIGFGLYVDAARVLKISGSYPMVGLFSLLNSGNATQIHMGIVPSTRKLRICRGANGTLLAESTTGIADNNWYYIELRVLAGVNNGELELRINGQVEFSLTGAATSWTTTEDFQQMRLGLTPMASTANDFGGSAGEGLYWIDDFIVFDASQGVVWPQGAAIMMLAPEEDGEYSEWNSTGEASYSEIDETAFMAALPDEDTTYLSATIENARVEVALTEPTIVDGDILGVQIVTRARNANLGLGRITPYLRVGQTVVEGAELGPALDYNWYSNPIVPLNPVTGLPWTTQDLEALMLGWKAT